PGRRAAHARREVPAAAHDRRRGPRVDRLRLCRRDRRAAARRRCGLGPRPAARRGRAAHEESMSCCAVTGANGFVGAHVVRELLHRGHEVVALVGAEQDSLSLDGLDVGLRELDIRDPGSVRAALAGADAVVHAAATYAFWAADRHDIYRVNVDGTRNVLEAARHLGVGRLVHVSSAATLAPTSENADDPARPSGEDGVLDLSRFRGHYKASKAMAEKLAVRAGAVVVRPTTVIGPGDRRPTPSGSMILHYLEGHMKVLVEMRQNVVDVRDVASGIALALERGATGGRYVLGGDNMTMRRLCA